MQDPRIADGLTGWSSGSVFDQGRSHPVHGAKSQRRWPSLPLCLWIVGIALLPVYVFDSGNPQPSHVILLAAAITAYARFGTYAPQFARLVRAYGLFVAVITVVTIGWAIVLPTEVSLAPPAFAVFNFVIFRTALVLYTHEGRSFLRLSAYTLGAVLVCLAAYSVFTGQFDTVRSAGTFNNPNQQAFFVIVVVSALVAIGSAVRLDWRLELTALVAATYLIATANSKAGLLAMAVVLLLVARMNIRIALAVAGIGIALVAFTSIGGTTYDRLEARVTRQQNDDTFEARGYNLILSHPEYLIVGSGEGYDERFGFPSEIHSTVGTIAFAYGIAGALTFGTVLVMLGRAGGVVSLMFMVPSLVYGLAHNGLRFAPFWILLALVVSSIDARASSVMDARRTETRSAAVRTAVPDPGQASRVIGTEPQRS